MGAPPPPGEATEWAVGATDARYALLEPLGRGATGVVFAAYDRDLDRRVAIKLLRARQGTGETVADARARLLAEARSLAKLADPYVVQVFDVGVYGRGEMRPRFPGITEADEQPAPAGVFIVMELVEGTDLREWLRTASHSSAQILDLMLACGRGLAAAHASGLVHRDFKPSNVLIGDDGRPRVVDFGLARAAATPISRGPVPPAGADAPEDPDDSTPREVAGTPAYMAPEQHRGEPASVAADQFAFCVVCFEALRGLRPYSGDSLDTLSRAKQAGRVERLADFRPRWAWRVLRRGLDPDPARRFASMDALLRALERGRFHSRASLAALVGIPLLALAAAGVYAAGAESSAPCSEAGDGFVEVWNPEVEQRIARSLEASRSPYASASFRSAGSQLDAYVEHAVHLSQRACTAGRDDAPLRREIASWKRTCLDGARAQLQALVSSLEESDPGLVEHLVEIVGGLPDLSRCDDETVALAEVRRDANSRRRVDELRRSLADARRLQLAARLDEAETAIAGVLASARSSDLPAARARAALELGRIESLRGDFSSAQEHLHEAIVAAEAAGDEDSLTEARISLLHLMGVHLDRHAEAESMHAALLARIERRNVEDALTAEFWRATGALRERQGRYDDALTAFERALDLRVRFNGRRSLEAAQALGAVGLARYRLGDYTGASEAFEAAADTYARLLGDEHPRVAKARERVAVVLAERGALEQAIEVQREVVRVVEHDLGHGNPGAIDATINLAVLQHKAGLDLDALDTIETALAREAASGGTATARYGLALGNSALVLRGLGRPNEAVSRLRAQLEIEQKVHGPKHRGVALAHLNLASVLTELGKTHEALTHADLALELAEAEAGVDPTVVASALGTKCAVHFARAENAVAEKACARALAMHDAQPNYRDDRLVGEVAFTLARLIDPREPERAAGLAKRALEALERVGADEEVRAWLRKRGFDAGRGVAAG